MVDRDVVKLSALLSINSSREAIQAGRNNVYVPCRAFALSSIIIYAANGGRTASLFLFQQETLRFYPRIVRLTGGSLSFYRRKADFKNSAEIFRGKII